MPLPARCVLVALDFLLLSSPFLIEQRFGAAVHPYFIATVLVIAVNAALVVWWESVARSASLSGERAPTSSDAAPGPATQGRPYVLPVSAIALALLLSAAHAWLREILIYPHDPWRADMLVVIQQGIRRFVRGANPYVMYDVPWRVPLPYGPGIWLPLVPAYLAHADVRFVTILGSLFVPVACAVAAIASARDGRWPLAASLLLLVGVIAFSPDLRHFMSIGHTQMYWPLLAIFPWLVVRERWRAAALVLGLLIVARTTMVAMAPVLLIAVWLRARDRFRPAALALAAAIAIPFLPFALADFASLKFALYDSYQIMMKTFVWTSTNWTERSIGVTGRLIARRWTGAVEIAQIAAMIAVYAAAWIAIRRGRPPVPWMAASLLAFSMTTLWPVVYIYFDVFLLFACAALAETTWVRQSPAIAWLTTFAVCVLVEAAAALAMIPANPSIDAGTDRDRPYLYAGFSTDEHMPDRTYAWVEGTQATILVPRRSRSAATIEILCQPHGPERMTVVLNTTLLDTVSLDGGWRTVSLAAPPQAWQYGVNELKLTMSSAPSPREIGEGPDPRKLSIAIDRLNVATK